MQKYSIGMAMAMAYAYIQELPLIHVKTISDKLGDWIKDNGSLCFSSTIII